MDPGSSNLVGQGPTVIAKKNLTSGLSSSWRSLKIPTLAQIPVTSNKRLPLPRGHNQDLAGSFAAISPELLPIAEGFILHHLGVFRLNSHLGRFLFGWNLGGAPRITAASLPLAS